MIATYQPETDILSASKIDLDLEEILTDLDANDFAAAMGVYESGTNSDQTLQSISQPGATSMVSDTWWPIYKVYWADQINYADEFVQKYGGAGAAYQDATRVELVKKGIAYQGVWMYAVHKFETAIADCLKGTTADVNSAKLNWDKGMAYYFGSLEGEYQTSADIASKGNLLYALAQKRCSEFGTCATPTDRTPLAAVNDKIQSAAIDGSENYLYHQVACNDAGLERAFKGMVSQMTVPLVQGLLRYAWKADPEMEDSCDGQENTDADAVAANDAVANTDCAKSWAEGWAFAAAVLPQLDQCSSSAPARAAPETFFYLA